MRAEHEELSLEDGGIAQREMHGHLVSVEVSVERRTCQRMQLYGLALDKLGLECLDTQTVQGRGTVQEDGMAFHHVLQDIPDDGLFLVHYLLGRTDCLDDTPLNQFSDDERLGACGARGLRR